MITVKIHPQNGLSITNIGHLAQGEHTVDLKVSDLKGAEGITIVDPSINKPATKK